MKSATAIAAFAAVIALPSLAQPTVPNAVFLDHPGVLDRIERENPDHYRRITGIIEASGEACRRDEVGEQLRVKYEAVKATCGALLKTSHPAKFTLAFQLDDTHYLVTATQRPAEKLIKVPPPR